MTTSPSLSFEPEQVHHQFTRDGFLIHRKPVLDKELLERAVQGLLSVRNCISDTGEEPASGWAHSSEAAALTKIEQPQLASEALRNALNCKQLGELAAAAMGASMVQVWWVQGLVKPGTPGTKAATTVGWHQDKTYWGDWENDSELFTAWLALSDVTEDAGPMVFVPGSHRWGLLPGGDFFAQDQAAIRSAIHIPSDERWTEVLDTMPAGGVSLHNQLLFHGSNANQSRAPRLSLAIHMRTEKSVPKPGKWVAQYLDRPEICPVIYDSGKP
jgi:hypothetical protein